MAVGGVDAQAGTTLSALRNVGAQNRAETQRTDEAREARLGTTNTSQTDAQQERAGIGQTGGASLQTGGNAPGQALDSQSLNALIQATQEQDDRPPATTDAPTTTGTDNDADDEARQQQVAAGNVTNSLTPGSVAGSGNSSADTRGVSLLV